MTPELIPSLGATILRDVLPHMAQLDADRRELLSPLIEYVADCSRQAEPAKLTFICTHNSRRSHFAQVWAAVAASYYGLERVKTFSGGTEVTALHPNAVRALAEQGFIVQSQPGQNPHYRLTFAVNRPSLECYSKVFDDPANPAHHFVAIMTCDAAHEACPVVPGAALRLPITYDDPKAYDATPLEQAKYAERSLQIAREMFHVFSQASLAQ